MFSLPIANKGIWACLMVYSAYSFQKSLKIPKGYVEAVRKSKDRQNNVWKKREKKTNNVLQSNRQKTIDCATCTPLKFRGEPRYSWRVSSFCSTCDARPVTLKP